MTIVNRLEFSEITGISTGSVSNMLSDGMPSLNTERKQGENVNIDTVFALKWLTEREIKKRFGRSRPKSYSNGEQEDSVQVRNDIEVEKRRKLRIENDEAESMLVQLEDVAILFNEAIVSLASQLDGAAGKMAAGDAVLRDRLKDEHRRIRATFSATLHSFTDGAKSSFIDETATEAGSMEVG